MAAVMENLVIPWNLDELPVKAFCNDGFLDLSLAQPVCHSR